MAIWVSGFICQEILVDELGVLSAFKLGDHVTLEIPPLEPGRNVVIAQKLQATALVLFRSDEPVTIEPETRLFDPSGSLRSRQSYETLSLSGGAAGHNLRLNLISMSIATPGLWHLDVLLNGELKLWIPFEIKHKLIDDPNAAKQPTGSLAVSEQPR